MIFVLYYRQYKMHNVKLLIYKCNFYKYISSYIINLRVSCNFMTDTVSNFKVTDRRTFIEFIDVLRQDLIDNPETWENKKLDDFLEALSSYAEDIQGYYDNTKQNVNADEANWQTFADIFKGASIYE